MIFIYVSEGLKVIVNSIPPSLLFQTAFRVGAVSLCSMNKI